MTHQAMDVLRACSVSPLDASALAAEAEDEVHFVRECDAHGAICTDGGFTALSGGVADDWRELTAVLPPRLTVPDG